MNTRLGTARSLNVEVQPSSNSDVAFGTNSSFMRGVQSTVDEHGNDDLEDTEVDETIDDESQSESMNLPAVLPSMDLSTLTPKRLFELVFLDKKIYGGYVARDAFKKIKERVGSGKFAAITDDPKLASRKTDEQEQCTQFMEFCANLSNKDFIYKIVESYLFRNSKKWEGKFILTRSYTEAPLPPSELEEDQNEITPENLRARVATLGVDDAGKLILGRIYLGVQNRQELDDRNQRGSALWKDLVDIFNSEEYTPTNTVQDSRCNDINPSLPPSTPWQPEKLRTVFNQLRTKYTQVYDNFKQSGQMEESEDHSEGDDDFFSKYAGGDAVLLFIHILWERDSPAYCTRLLPQSNQTEQGISGSSQCSSSRDTPQSATKKRGIEQVVKQVFEPLKQLLEPMVSNSVTINLDDSAKLRNTTMVELMNTQQSLAAAQTKKAQLEHVQSKISFLTNMLSNENISYITRERCKQSIDDLTVELTNM